MMKKHSDAAATAHATSGNRDRFVLYCPECFPANLITFGADSRGTFSMIPFFSRAEAEERAGEHNAKMVNHHCCVLQYGVKSGQFFYTYSMRGRPSICVTRGGYRCQDPECDPGRHPACWQDVELRDDELVLFPTTSYWPRREE